MKKHLFFIASVFAAVSLQAQNATMTVASNTGMKVEPSTLLYVKGNMKVKEYTSPGENKRVHNEGHIKITDKLINENGSGNNFFNTYSTPGKYGQLIILGSVDGNTKIATSIKLSDNFVFHPIAIPYSNLKAQDLLVVYNNPSSISFTQYKYENKKEKYFDKNRKSNPVFVWYDGEKKIKDEKAHYLKNLAANDLLKPGLYYSVNKITKDAGGFKNTKFEIEGQPAPGELSVSLVPYKITNNNDANDVGEYYGSYIFDYTENMPDMWTDYKKTTAAGNFGANIFNLGNPYTSNIDLAKLLAPVKNRLKTVVQYTQGTFSENQSNSYGINKARPGASSTGATFSAYVPKDDVGDKGEMRYVRPMQTFSVKLNNNESQDLNLTFNNNIKTFDEVANTPNILFNKKKAGGAIVNQLGIDLYDEYDRFTGIKTYVVASDIYEASKKGVGTELYNPQLSDKHLGIYTLQENEDGTVNEELAREKTYINGVNGDKYIAKPIHLVFQNGEGKYTFKARFNEDLEKNRNTFYFEDKKIGKITKVNKDFSYTFDIEGTDKDRFVLYWAATPSKVDDNVVAEGTVDTTVVFKDGAVSKIRFDRRMGRADIFVYNISGQLISSDKNVNTEQDYIVPLFGNTSVYILKIVGNNGQVITKKIIK